MIYGENTDKKCLQEIFLNLRVAIKDENLPEAMRRIIVFAKDKTQIELAEVGYSMDNFPDVAVDIMSKYLVMSSKTLYVTESIFVFKNEIKNLIDDLCIKEEILFTEEDFKELQRFLVISAFIEEFNSVYRQEKFNDLAQYFRISNESILGYLRDNYYKFVMVNNYSILLRNTKLIKKLKAVLILAKDQNMCNYQTREFFIQELSELINPEHHVLFLEFLEECIARYLR